MALETSMLGRTENKWKKNSSVANEEATIEINRTSLIWYFGINLFVFIALNVNSSQKAQPINMFSTFCIEFKRTALNRIARLCVFKSVTSYCIQIRLSLKWMMQRRLFQKMKENFCSCECDLSKWEKGFMVWGLCGGNVTKPIRILLNFWNKKSGFYRENIFIMFLFKNWR